MKDESAYCVGVATRKTASVGETPSTTIRSDPPVPNYTPHVPGPERIAIVGEAPGEEEVRAGRPFVGRSGRLLAALLDRNGIRLEQTFLGNVSQHRPAGNKFSLFKWDGPEVQEGLEVLRTDLTAFRPSVVILCGAQALRAAACGKLSIDDYRGTVLHPTNGSPMRDMVCLATYHPAYTLRVFSATKILAMDLKRAVWIAKGGNFTPPPEEYDLSGYASTIIARLAELRKNRTPSGVDIEGVPEALRCVSIAWSASEAMIVPASALRSADVEEAFRDYLADANAPKVFHNGLYDVFVLGWKPYHYVVKGIVSDTMFAEWELLCEMPKSLMDCASRHTWRPYWKGDWRTTDLDTLHRYCCRDATATIEIHHAQQRVLSDSGSKRHLSLNVGLLPAFIELELRGIKYDVRKAAERIRTLTSEFHAAQYAFNRLTGASMPAVTTIFKKKFAGMALEHATIEHVLKDYATTLPRIRELMTLRRPTPSDDGELSVLLGTHRNVESRSFQDYLYNDCRFPVQYKRADADGIKRKTADEMALLRLIKLVDSPIPKAALGLRRLLTRIQALTFVLDDDGRVRATYNPVGQETGRVSCSKSPTGSGFNLTTVAHGDRDLIIADDDHWLCQCDLEGADNWTVAAHLASLSAPQLIKDLRAGLKPAKVLVVLHHDPSLVDAPSEAFIGPCKAVDKDAPIYLTFKRILHGGSYRMGARTCSATLFKDTDGEIDLPERAARDFLALVDRRYHVTLYHGHMMRVLRREPVLRAPSGHVRRFHNRPDAQVQEGLAHEPQANTTYATNLAFRKCFDDPDNQPIKGRRRIEVVHHIHDALLFQFRKRDLAHARKKIRQWFDNPIVIAGQPITIPFAGQYGRSWGELTEGKL